LIASIVRAPYVQIFATNPDFTRKQAEAGIWSLVELNMGIVCNNLMRLKPFLNRYLPKFLSYLGLSSGKSKQKKSDSPKSISKGKWKRKSSQGYQLHSIGNGDSSERSGKKSGMEDDGLQSLSRDTSHPNFSSERIWKD